MEILYVNNKRVDLDKVSIPLSYTSNLFVQPSDIASDHSFTVKAPRTANNESVFAHPEVVGKANNLLRTYNNAILIKDGVQIIKNGTLVLISATDSYYSFCLVWGFSAETSANLKLISSLTNISDNAAHLEWTPKDLVVPGHKDLVVPGHPNFADFGFANYDCGVNLDAVMLYSDTEYPLQADEPEFSPVRTVREYCNVHPYISLAKILDMLEEAADFQLILPASVTADLAKGFVLLTGDVAKVRDEYLLDQKDRTDSNHAIDEVYDDSGGLVFYYMDFSNRLSYIKDDDNIRSVVVEPHIQLNGILDYTPVHPSIHNESWGYKINEAIDDMTVEVTMTANKLFGSDIGSNQLYIMLNYSNPWAMPNASLGQRLLYEGSTHSASGVYERTIISDIPEDGVIYFAWKTGNTGTLDPDTSSLVITFSQVATIEVHEDTKLEYPKMYMVTDNLPPISGFDFVKLIANLYGLYFAKNDTAGVIELKSYEDIGNASPIDLSDNFIFYESVEWKMSGYAQENTFTFTQDDDELDIFDGELLVDDDTLAATKEFIKIPLSATPDDLAVRQYVLTELESSYKLTESTKGFRLLGGEAFLATGPIIFDASKYDFANLKSYYTRYQEIIEHPTVMKVSLRLTTYEVVHYDWDRPIYFRQFGAKFMTLSMKVSGDICTLTIIKI